MHMCTFVPSLNTNTNTKLRAHKNQGNSYTHSHKHTCTHAYTHTHTHTNENYTYMYTYIPIHTNTHIHKHVHVCKHRPRTQRRIHTLALTFSHIHMHTHTIPQTHVQTNTHITTCNRPQMKGVALSSLIWSLCWPRLTAVYDTSYLEGDVATIVTCFSGFLDNGHRLLLVLVGVAFEKSSSSAVTSCWKKHGLPLESLS